MTLPQIEILSLLAVALVLFGWGRWRHDVVALAVLFVAVGLGLVKAEEAFAGFGHPAVITVAAAVVISRAISMTGILDRVATRLTARTTNPVLILILLCLPAGIASGFMNNIAALALVMPVAIAVCQNAGHSPSMVLMPLSYITVLGGVLTLIGTPPNIIISGIRADRLGEGFKLFDFAPLGLAILITGTLFVAFIGWRFIPQRISAGRTGSGRVQEYLLEATVDEESPLIGKLLGDVSVILEDSDAGLLGLKRGSVTVPGAAQWTQVRAGDVLLIEAAPDTVGPLLGPLSLSLVKPGRDVPVENKANDLHIAEAVVRPYGAIIGLTPAELRLRQRFTVNLLGVAREGTNTFSGLKDWRFNAGDVMLLQGEEDCVEDAISELGLLPLEQRDLTLQRPSTALPTLAIALAGLGALILELAPAAVCLGAAATLLLVTRRLSLREAYQSIDASVLVMLAALMPVGDAFDSTGTTGLLAKFLADLSGDLSAIWLLAAILLLTMWISDMVNNSATALLMAPLAIDLAKQIEANPDAFLMAVVVGASCAFLSPIGHQNNLLVMGPGGYRFTDYWRLGLPLQIVVFITAMVVLPMLWPL
ncbi:MAG TPA: SLC13 family permease [Ferrovibrio sp.]|uniref:SLC13 family permease n=1 Tax=Ferrovibrio sp. TaxID=1917215 RepID=UPI002B4B2951|nr:SLC13 family permease [Ferrovibrio sp.]HLT77164.1 SLC13 family permease [Ferrovibrio sp.]